VLVHNDTRLAHALKIDDRSRYAKYLDEDIPYIEIILYYLEHAEINAYIAQLNQALKGKHFRSPMDAIEYLNRYSSTYYNYKYLYNLFNNDEYINRLGELGFKTSTINKFKKITRKTWNKLVNHIYHILIDNGALSENALSENVLLRIDDKLVNVWDR